jgi:hypothetical protein
VDSLDVGGDQDSKKQEERIKVISHVPYQDVCCTERDTFGQSRRASVGGSFLPHIRACDSRLIRFDLLCALTLNQAIARRTTPKV